MVDAVFDQRLDQLGGQFRISGGQQFARLGIDDVMSEDLALEVLGGHGQLVDARLCHVADMLRRDSAAFLDDYLATELDVKGCGFPAQTLGHQTHLDFFLREIELVGLEEHFEHLFVRHLESPQDDRHRQLATAVDSREHAILGIKLEIEPGPAVRDDACREKQLAGAVRLALVVIEEHARRAMQL